MTKNEYDPNTFIADWTKSLSSLELLESVKIELEMMLSVPSWLTLGDFEDDTVTSFQAVVALKERLSKSQEGESEPRNDYGYLVSDWERMTCHTTTNPLEVGLR